VIFDGLLSVVCPWFVIQATSINIQSLTLLINRSTDITYIKIAGGMVYMAAIIDWHSKAVLSHRISNTTLPQNL
jgi:hypothetical protein